MVGVSSGSRESVWSALLSARLVVHPRERIEALLLEIRRRHSALARAWDSHVLDRVAAELSRRFGFEEALVRALIRDEIGDRTGPVPTHNQSRTRSDLEAMKPDDTSGS